MRRFFYILIILSVPLSLLGQERRYIDFEVISTAQGLSHGSVSCMLQDRLGFLWIGTSDGLNKYDGYTFKPLKKDPKDENSLSSNSITAIVEGDSDILWIGTDGGGLNRMAMRTLDFDHYTHDPQDPGSLGSNYITTLLLDSDGILWIGTRDGLNRLDTKTERFTRFRKKTDGSGPSDSYILTLAQSSSGDTWIGTRTGGLNKFDRKNQSFVHYNDTAQRTASPGDYNCIQAIIEDPNGMLWLGGKSSGLVRFDPSKNKFIPFIHPTQKKPLPGCTDILSLLRDINGEVWVGTAKNGIYILDPVSGDFKHFTADFKKNTTLNNNYIQSIFEDRTGIVFLCTAGGGINKVDLWKRKFKHIKNNPFDPSSLIDNNVTAICQDRKGRLWVGTESGLELFDRETGACRHYALHPGIPNNPNSNSILCIFEDSLGNLWISTKSGGLDRRDETRDAFVHYDLSPGNNSDADSNQVFAIYEDHLTRLWAGFAGGRLSQVSRENKKNSPIDLKYDEASHRCLVNNRVSAIREDSQGNLWIGTCDGLRMWKKNLFAKLSHVFSSFRHDPDHPDSISNNTINCIFSGNDGGLWIGTMNGLNRREETGSGFIRYFVEDGLPGNVIYGILESEKGDLWISTNNGLSHFDAGKREFRNYDSSDGLQGNEFNPNAYFKTPDGEMFFGGQNGFNVFLPGAIKHNPFAPPIVITDAKKFSEPLEWFPQQDVCYETRIVLTFKEKFISFEFAALDYTNPRQNRYWYKLENSDSDWREGGTHRYANYTHLKGGDYLFRVKACNSDGVMNEEGIAVEIEVIPPFYETLLFQIILSAFIIMCAVATYTWVAQNTRRKRQKLERLVSERTGDLLKAKEKAEIAARTRAEFLAKMSHEIRTPMNGIIGITELALQEKDLEEQRKNLAIINSCANDLLAIINDILDFSKVQFGQLTLECIDFDLHEAVSGVVKLLRIQARKKNLKLEYFIDPGIPRLLRGDPSRFRQVLMNLLSNAIKFTDEGGITLDIRPADNPPPASGEANDDGSQISLLAAVSDTGIGVPPEKQELIFVPFRQADNSTTRKYGGSGLGLSISTRIVQLMGGSIWVESPSNPEYPCYSAEKIKSSPKTAPAVRRVVSAAGGPGSIFYFNISLSVPPQEKKAAVTAGEIFAAAKDRPHSPQLGSFNMLVAEDNKINQKLIKKMLLMMGHQVTIVSDGKEALEKFKSASFDMVITDIQMPEMDGIQLTHSIRKMGSRIPIVALTAHAMKGDREKFINEGMDAYVSKPVKAQALVEAIASVVPLIKRSS